MEFGRSIRFNRTAVIVFLLLVGIFTLYLLVGSGDSNYVDKTIKISELLSASIYLAEKAGNAVYEVRQGKDPQIAAKVKESPRGKEYVTLGDQKSHAIITRGLTSVWPTLQYRSEEKDDKSGSSMNQVFQPPLHNSEISRYLQRDEAVSVKDLVVWIDPLDATQEYTEGGEKPELLKYVTVMICIVVKGEPIASVIHQPFVKGQKGQQGSTYWSWVNHGVSSNVLRGAELPSSTSSDSADVVRLISSRSHAGNVKKTADKAFKGQKVQHITAAGAGYKSLEVARNKADVYFHTTRIKKWDTCAGDALISAVGGAMTTRKGQYITYSIKSNPELSDGLVVARTEKKHKLYYNKLMND